MHLVLLILMALCLLVVLACAATMFIGSRWTIALFEAKDRQ